MQCIFYLYIKNYTHKIALQEQEARTELLRKRAHAHTSGELEYTESKVPRLESKGN